MKAFKYILNLPWTMIALILSIISIPTSLRLKDRAIVIKARSFWWHPVRGVRAFTLGNVIVVRSNTLLRDLEHEYVHVEQHMREPLIHPLLAIIELQRHGYKGSKYEREAYQRAGNVFNELI